MKTKLLVITFLLLSLTVNSYSQIKVDIVACPQINEGPSLRVGSNFDMPISTRWSFVPGLYWSLRNRESTRNTTANGSKTEYEYSDKAHFITIPLNFGLRIPCKDEEKISIKLLFGPYIAYGINGNSKTTMNKDGKITENRVNAFASDGRYKNRFDYGLNYGLNVRVKQHYMVGIFNEIGFRKIYNGNNKFEEVVGEIFIVSKINFALGISLGYQF